MGMRILYVDDEAANVTVFKYAFEQYDLTTTSDPLEALGKIRDGSFAVLVTDQRMPGMDGLALARQARELVPDLVVVLVTAYSSQELLAEALNSGLVWRFVAKPWEPDAMAALLDEALAVARGRLEHQEDYVAGDHIAEIVEADARAADQRLFWSFENAAMVELLTRLEQVATSDTSVLIQGETGTGKEQIARRLHRLSRRRNRPFVAVNCGAITEGLIEAELFGHRKGAFTGAVADRAGQLALADGGTLFLDEVAELSPRGQAALLRVLQEGAYLPVGGDAERHTDFRLVAATHRDLRAMVDQGSFREDLYWRVTQFTMTLPSLRERPEDLQKLFAFFATRIGEQLGRPILSLEGAMRQQVLAYDWPGNLRELETEIRRVYLIGEMACGGSPEPSPDATSTTGTGAAIPPQLALDGPLDERLATIEKRWIEEALEHAQGNVAEAARELGLKRPTLLYRMKKLDIED